MTPFERLRLFVSYQRYAFALFALTAAMVYAAQASGSLIAWLIVAVPVVVTLRFAVFVASRFTDKMRATRIATIRISQGRFRPESMRRHCNDPCFRVVASECFSRAGMPRTERRSLIQQYKSELRDEPATLLLRDPHTGRTILIGGETTTN